MQLPIENDTYMAMALKMELKKQLLLYIELFQLLIELYVSMQKLLKSILKEKRIVFFSKIFTSVKKNIMALKIALIEYIKQKTANPS